ncbi:MAG: hypothetical protein IT423_17295, partial [Pirellulaceae bacterium]|nr:hypothetical protein [Pirellulaceae bacterium]
NFNQELRGLKDQRLETLLTVRCAMTSAEIGHWIGFVTMGLLAGAVWTAERNSLLLAATLILNVLGNACLSLLQQYNKLRIDQIVSRKKRTGQSRIADNRKRCPG